MKRLENENLVIISSVAVLLVLVVVFAHLNAGNVDLKKDLEIKAEFVFVHDSDSYRVTMNDVLALNPVEFTAVMNTSTTDPTPVTFTGVELSKLCERYNIHISPDSVVLVKALDGYASALTGSEVLTEDNVYICIHMNGEALKPKKEGGLGPYLMVIKNVQFSQRWCKFVEEIEVR
ncbi:MAG: molybdopterin-dependent oxidoreductase [Firmicutes bacterium]|nr:molybdopterin-dependent oxidoreductase [Bacillota bacterium]